MLLTWNLKFSPSPSLHQEMYQFHCVRNLAKNGKSRSDFSSHRTNTVVCNYGGSPRICLYLCRFQATEWKCHENSGFWQVPLAKESRLLITFITPQGCFCFNKLPFGITNVPEQFQCRMSEILNNIPGVVCHVDNVLVFGKDQTEQNDRLHAVLQKIQTAGFTLNKDKYQFSCSRMVMS